MSVAACADSMEHLPRTLIVSEAPFGLNNGFGVTLGTFFSGWADDRLFMLYTRQETNPSGLRRDRSAFAPVPGHAGRRSLLPFLAGRRAEWRGRYSACWLRRTLDGWRPDVVYTMVFSGGTLAYASWIARHFNVPLVAHVADDGLETERGGATTSIADLLARADVRVCISEEMRQEYAKRYGVDSHVLHNGASEDLFAPAAAAEQRDTEFVIRYLGSIVPSQHFSAIEDIAAAVRSLAGAGLPVRFEIWGGSWTQQHAEKLTDGRAVVYRGVIGQAEGFALLKSADLLTIPISFDAVSFSKNRLSLPTKLAECLASGTPTLVYGPPGAAPVEFCRRHRVGSFIDERSVDRVVACIRQMIDNRSAARVDATPGREFVRQHYSATRARDAFRAILHGAVLTSR
jgi:glycosyltransferase involved in cell wall biosynthesis